MKELNEIVTTKLAAFYTAVMDDLNQREFMFKNMMNVSSQHKDQLQEMLTQAQNIRLLITRRAREFGLTNEESPDEIELKQAITAQMETQSFDQALLTSTPSLVNLSLHAMHLALSELVTVVREQPDNTVMYRDSDIKQSGTWRYILDVVLAYRLHQKNQEYCSPMTSSIIEISPSAKEIQEDSL